jgi:hypothetical protein
MMRSELPTILTAWLFLMSTYEAAAINGKWNRKVLETTLGVPWQTASS